MDLRLNRKVAVKILSGSLFGDSVALRRFKREAQVLARLNHQNIVAVHDYGELHTEGAFLLMDLFVGETLSAVIKREGRVHPQAAAEWFDQVLEGVKTAHGTGIIHRDLKPDNIFITRQKDGKSQIKILDFGLAKFTQRDVSDPYSMTTPGVVMGTFGYMSIEQLTGGKVDERSDLFSIGVMVVEALTGRRPFTGKTLVELLHSMEHDSLDLESNAPEAHRLNEVLQKCLAKDRAERFSSAAEMQRELIPSIHSYSLLVSARADADTLIAES